MDAKFVVKIQREGAGHIAMCPSVGVLSKLGATEDDARENLRIILKNYLETSAKALVTRSFTDGVSVNCPEGAVRLPVDVWVCKLSDDVCRLQARIDKTNASAFHAGCSAPEARQLAIWSTVQAGKYLGFHHVPGRYLCPGCREGEKFKYFYPFELTFLKDFIGPMIESETRRVRTLLLQRDMPLAILSSRVCPSCVLSFTSILWAGAEVDLRVERMEFFPR